MAETHASRNALLWLLLAQVAVIAPHLGILPVWTGLSWLLVAFWYWKIYRGDWHFPGRLQTWSLAGFSIAGIALEYRTALALEPQMALLVTAFILKLLELKSARDHWLLLMLSYFIIGVGFVFDTSIKAVLIALLQLFILLLAQQALFRPEFKPRAMASLTLKLFAQSIPLMVVIFVLFPRVGPLWSVPLPSETGRTGFSDHMEPGQISRLLRSSDLAFRVSFDGAMPPRNQLYWRGLVLEHFDGRSWTRQSALKKSVSPQAIGTRRFQYTIILEQGIHDWLFTIPAALINRDDVIHNNRYEWQLKNAVSGRLSYSVQSYPDQPLDQSLQKGERYINLQLPPQTNPQTTTLAQTWRGMPSREVVQQVEAFFHRQPFVYTLEPPLLGEHSVDDFIFGSRRGFCEHYASAFVVMMRSAGVPARVVLGYQGGEYNEAGNYLLVHQSDAHAWAEVWLEDEGWVRVDPTSWVAPDRIELGTDSAMAGQSGYLADDLVSLRKLKQIALFSKLRHLLDRVEYQWVRWIVNYDSNRQWELVNKLFGHYSLQGMVITLVVAFSFPLLISLLLSLRSRSKVYRSAALTWYLRCRQQLLKRGFTLRPGESPAELEARVRAADREIGQWFAEVRAAFYQAEYARQTQDQATSSLRVLKELYRRGPPG